MQHTPRQLRDEFQFRQNVLIGTGRPGEHCTRFPKNVHLNISYNGTSLTAREKWLAITAKFDTSSRAVAIRQRSCRRFLPIRDLCATASLRFIVLCFFTKTIINNAAFRHRRGDVYAARLMDLRNRWRHGRWCPRYGKGSCFNSTRGHTGSLLVEYNFVGIVF